MCLPHKFNNCQSIDDCQTDACCSDAFGLLTHENKICLPNRFCSAHRATGESCLNDLMCVSNYCSGEGKCDNKEDVSEISNKSLNKTASVLKRKIEIKARTKRNVQAFSYSTRQYCSDYKTYYYSYSFYCPSEIDDFINSISSLYYTAPSSSYSSSSSSKYSYSQYCSSYSTYYYSKSYYCPSSSSSSLSIGVTGLNNAAKTAGNIVGAIIGTIVGVIVLIVSIIIICCCCCKKKQQMINVPPPAKPSQ
jgi:hypothetical protein